MPDLYFQNIVKNDTLLLEQFSQKMVFPCKNPDQTQEFNDLFATIAKEHTTENPAHRLALYGRSTLLIAAIISAHPLPENMDYKASSQKHRLLHAFQKLISENFKVRLSVAGYADKLNITPTHLSRICRDILSTPASKLIDERSLLEAKRLLTYTSLTIAEISYELGYCDPAHFSKFFQGKTGQKPSDFRKNFINIR